MDNQGLARWLYRYAERHYNDSFGWSEIVECWNISEIQAELDQNKILDAEAAVQHFSEIVKIRSEAFEDAMNS